MGHHHPAVWRVYIWTEYSYRHNGSPGQVLDLPATTETCCEFFAQPAGIFTGAVLSWANPCGPCLGLIPDVGGPRWYFQIFFPNLVFTFKGEVPSYR